MIYQHLPVMVEEVIHYLRPKVGSKIIDCTLGAGGHTEALIKRICPGGKILGIDLDLRAFEATTKINQKNKNCLTLVNDNFKNLEKIANDHKFNQADGILLDLGLSSGQLQDQARGFSFLASGPLDMRFGRQTDLTASQILNTRSLEKLIEIFKNFGEEKLAVPIARKIITSRKISPITEPAQLVKIVSAIYRKFYKAKSKINPATKIFQALRIAVNQELENLENVLPQTIKLLARGGRLAVISYHSLEDKIVKDFFRRESRDCICPPELPICQCSHLKKLKIITKKPVLPKPQEIIENPRARSAKLRVTEKI